MTLEPYRYTLMMQTRIGNCFCIHTDMHVLHTICPLTSFSLLHLCDHSNSLIANATPYPQSHVYHVYLLLVAYLRVKWPSTITCNSHYQPRPMDSASSKSYLSSSSSSSDAYYPPSLTTSSVNIYQYHDGGSNNRSSRNFVLWMSQVGHPVHVLFQKCPSVTVQQAFNTFTPEIPSLVACTALALSSAATELTSSSPAYPGNPSHRACV